MNVFAYDLGAELGLVRPMSAGWEFKPFFGLGAGARTYDYKSSLFSSRTSAAGYASLGSEFQLSPVALRIEARENVFDFRSPLASEASKTRTDIGLLFGFAYHFR